MQYIAPVDTTSASSLLLNRIRVLVVRFGDALPFAVDLQEKKDVREVDRAAPTLFEDAHDRERFFEFQHVDARLEVLARAEGVGLPEGAQRLSREAVTRGRATRRKPSAFVRNCAN